MTHRLEICCFYPAELRRHKINKVSIISHYIINGVLLILTLFKTKAYNSLDTSQGQMLLYQWHYHISLYFATTFLLALTSYLLLSQII